MKPVRRIVSGRAPRTVVISRKRAQELIAAGQRRLPPVWWLYGARL